MWHWNCVPLLLITRTQVDYGWSAVEVAMRSEATLPFSRRQLKNLKEFGVSLLTAEVAQVALDHDQVRLLVPGDNAG
jgi:hypothetical protein